MLGRPRLTGGRPARQARRRRFASSFLGLACSFRGMILDASYKFSAETRARQQHQHAAQADKVTWMDQNWLAVRVA
jgi:hypothetical protein